MGLYIWKFQGVFPYPPAIAMGVWIRVCPKYQILMTAQLAEKYLGNLQKDFNQSHSRLSAGITHTEAELTKPLEEYAGIGNVATEIRAALKAMPSGERMKFISEALERGDEKVLKSALGAPAFLSGMSQAEADHATRNYHAKCNPELAQRLEVMKKAREKLNWLSALWFRLWRKLWAHRILKLRSSALLRMQPKKLSF